MEITKELVVSQGLSLAAAERADAVRELMESLDPDAETLIDDAWAAELDRRFDAFMCGEAAGIPWSVLKDEK